jgi:MoaA/NifB/PqqE/SkfB family radical SAM enzyme
LGPLATWAFTRFFDVYNDVGAIGAADGANVYTLYVPPIPTPMHARHTENFVRRWLSGTRIPLAVTIAVTDECQCQCVHCSAIEGGSQGPLLSVDEVRRVVNESVALGVTNVTFTGGEPLLRDDLEEVVAAVPGDKAVSLVFTNGIGLTSARARRLRGAGLWGVQISLDSDHPDVHDRLRGWPGCFAAVRSGIAAAKEAGLFVGLSTYATNDFVRGGVLGRLAALGASWGVHELTVFDAIPTGRLRNQHAAVLTDANRARLVQEGLALRAAYRGRMHVVTQAWTTSRTGFARFIGCLAGHYQFHVTADGRFRPCDFTPLSMGSVREASVSDLWSRLVSHPGYRAHRHECRMQCPAFRAKYVDAAPGATPG